jgi:hypothetical protein
MSLSFYGNGVGTLRRSSYAEESAVLRAHAQ